MFYRRDRPVKTIKDRHKLVPTSTQDSNPPQRRDLSFLDSDTRDCYTLTPIRREKPTSTPYLEIDSTYRQTGVRPDRGCKEVYVCMSTLRGTYPLQKPSWKTETPWWRTEGHSSTISEIRRDSWCLHLYRDGSVPETHPKNQHTSVTNGRTNFGHIEKTNGLQWPPPSEGRNHTNNPFDKPTHLGDEWKHPVSPH